MPIKPILFNTEMVRAILDGRKCCTRRIVKPQQFIGLLSDKCNNGMPVEFLKEKKLMFKPYCDMTDAELISAAYKAPYQIGDILYVRETWSELKDAYGVHKKYVYKASDSYPFGEKGYILKFRWHPSIHMPKEAARIWLKVANVRVERLQEITEYGAKAEGAIDNRGFIHSPDNEYDCIHTSKEDFIRIWNSTVKKSDLDRYGWDANPWVWIIEFKRCEKPK